MKRKRIVAGILTAGLLLTSVPLYSSAAGQEESTLPDPVMRVTFDDGTASDTTGRGNDGTVTGAPEFSEGISGNAIHIVNSDSGAPQQYVNFGQPEDLKFGTDDFTVSFWYKGESASYFNDDAVIFGNMNWDSGANHGIAIAAFWNGLQTNCNPVQGNRHAVGRSDYGHDGEWHHIAMSVDRDGDYIFYLDGEEKGRADISSEAEESIDTGLDVVLGADGNGRYGLSDAWIDELSVYKQTLTAEQVGELAAVTAPPASEPVMKITFDDGTADDATGRGNDGVVSGSPEFAEGIEGNAIHIVNPVGGEAEQYVDFGQTEDLQFGEGDFTISFWYKGKGESYFNDDAVIVGNMDWNSGANHGFAIAAFWNGLQTNCNPVQGNRHDIGRAGYGHDGKWHHIAMTVNRSGSSIFYLDGEEKGRVNISADAGESIDTGLNFVLGADGNHRFALTDAWIDELTVYKSAVSGTQIQNETAPYILNIKIADYEELAQSAEASDEKRGAFLDAINEVKQQAEGVTDPERIAELTEQLRKAYNAFIGPDDGIINFEVVSDTHIPGTDNNNETNRKLIDMFEDLKRDYPDSTAVLNCGDISADGAESEMEGYFNILDDYKDDFTIMSTLGNHDVRWRSGWDEIYERFMRYNQEYMGDTGGRDYYDKWLNGYHFIMLNTEWDLKDRAYLSPEQLEWLDETMAENSDPSKPIFVVVHQPLRDTYAVSNDWDIGVQDYALKEVLRKYPQTIIFTGHIHDGIGAMEVISTDYGVVVDVPSLRSNDYGSGRGQLGYHVTVYEDSVSIDLRDYQNDEWIPEYSYTVDLDPSSRPAGKVLDVNFDDGTASDLTGSGNDGTLVGDPEFVDDGNGGKALHIVNSDATATQAKKAEQYVDFGDKLRFGEEDFTIMFSYKGKTSGNGDGCVISNKNWDTGANPGFAIGAFAGENPGMGLNLNTEGGSRLDTARYDAATDGEWHEIAAVFDRDGQMILYIDGKAAGSADISGQNGNTVDVENLRLVLGADGNCQNGVRDMYIDNLKIYKKVLGAAELETAYNPYTAETGTDSITISWPLPSDADTEPAYLALDGERTVEIESGAVSATISGLEPDTEYTVLLVTREKANSGNYRDAYPFVVTTKSRSEEPLSTAVLEYALSLAETADTEGVVDSVLNNFNDAKAAAEDILARVQAGDTSVTQEMVDESWQNLIKAMQYLSFKQGDKTDLQKVIDLAGSLDLSKYLTEGQQAFTDALAAAEAVLVDGDAMQDEVDQSWRELLKAMSGLRLKPSKEALEDLISQAQAVDTSEYTEESAAAFASALARAVEVFENEEADETMVREAQEALKTSMELLVKGEDQNSGGNTGSGAEDEMSPGNTDTDSKTDGTMIAGTDSTGSADQNNTAGSGSSETSVSGAVKTGDETGVFWMIAVMAAALTAAAAVQRGRKRKP